VYQPGTPLRIRVVIALIAIVSSAGCPNYLAQQEQHDEEIKAADAALDRDRIPVLAGDLALPHDRLGELQYTEKFSPSAIDNDYIDGKLRTMAIQRWGNSVDALVGVRSLLSADASEIHVTASAVEVRGECSFCRHQGGYPQGR
jgi:hypothetical protein